MPVTRPRSVTLACFYAGAGGAVGAWDLSSWLYSWGSMDRPSAIGETGRPVIGAMLAACLSAIVFAAYALRGHNPSRVALTILGSAVVVFALFSLPGGLLPGVVAAVSVGLLWSASAQRFFRGIDPDEPVNLGARPTVPGRDQQLTPYSQFAAPTVAPSADRLPDPVLRALWITGGMSGAAAILMGVNLFVAVTAKDQLRRSITDSALLSGLVERSGVSVEEYLHRAVLSFAVVFVLSLLGVVTAVVARVWRQGGRPLLIVASVIALLTSLLFFPVGIPWSAAAVYVIVLLEKPHSRAWFS